VVRSVSDEIRKILAYFGVNGDARPLVGMIADRDLKMLLDSGMTGGDIDHSLRVADKAMEIAGRMELSGATPDLELVARGALFHDLGKVRTHGIEHGRIGSDMGRELGLPEEVTSIMEKHIRGGLSEAEAVELGLPVKDYRLHSMEERIIVYADRLVDIITDGIAGDAQAEERFEEILRGNQRYGKNEPTLERYLAYHREIRSLTGAR
jgi:uncharacterized protein